MFKQLERKAIEIKYNLVLSIILCSFTMDVFAGEDHYFAKDDEELYGDWNNLHYGINPPQKLGYNPDGTRWSATNANSKLPSRKIRYLITGMWNDSQGKIKYKTHWGWKFG